MIQAISIVQPTGDYLEIQMRYPEQSGYFIKSIDGLGPTKVDVLTTQSLYLDGGRFNTARAISRNIVIDLGILDDGVESVETRRNKLYRQLPPKTPLTFYILTDTLAVNTVCYVESITPNIFSKGEQTVQISLICPSAYLKDNVPVGTYFSGTTPTFTFPFSDPTTTTPSLIMGSIFKNTQANAFYTGDIPTGIYLNATFSGSVVDLVISNDTTGQSMAISHSRLVALLGSGLSSGDFLQMGTVPGNKFLYLSRGGNIYNILTSLGIVSDWITLQRGDNIIKHTATSGNTNAVLYVEHQVLHGGV